jgi:hypothetical protein
MLASWCIKKGEFQFIFFLPDPVGLIPMNFGEAYGAIDQTDACYSLELTPSALSILLAQSGTVTDTPAGGNCFKVRNLSNDFKVHVATCYQEEEGDANEKPNATRQARLEAVACTR